MGYVGRLTRYALKYKGHFFGFLAAAGIGTVFNVISPLVLVEIIDSVIVLRDYELLVTYTLVYLVLIAFYMIFDTAGRYVSALMAQHVIYDLRGELYDSLMEKDLAFYDQNETGQILARVTTDVTTMREFLFWGYRVIFIGIVTLIGTYVVMWTISPDLTIIMLTLIPFIFIFVLAFAKKVRPVLFAARSQYGVLSSVLAENVVGMRVVQSFAAADREYARVDEENRGFLKLRIEGLRLLSFYRPLLPTIFGIAVGILIYFGGAGYEAGGLSFGEFVGFVTLTSMLVLPGRFLSWGVGMYQRASASGERTFYILDVRDELMDPAEPVCVDEIEGGVNFENVYFSYRGDNFILRGVNLHVKPGQVVALLGGTGSGKSSLINLIPRFYDVDDERAFAYEGKAYRVDDKDCVEFRDKKLKVVNGKVEIDGQEITVTKPGRVLVDGVDVRSYRIEDIRRHIGIVHQDPFLFTDTIRENIAFARPEATLEEVQSAAKAAMIHDFVMTLEKGYDTVIGERGITLSGGQKQRVAIARALLANPKILILDDSTSSVDAKTEMMIQKALENLMAGRTTFIITHRLSTIRNADLIVMMERGQVLEVGSHEDLISQDGLYSSIFHTLAEMELAASYVGTKSGERDFRE